MRWCDGKTGRKAWATCEVVGWKNNLAKEGEQKEEALVLSGCWRWEGAWTKHGILHFVGCILWQLLKSSFMQVPCCGGAASEPTALRCFCLNSSLHTPRGGDTQTRLVQLQERVRSLWVPPSRDVCDSPHHPWPWRGFLGLKFVCAHPAAPSLPPAPPPLCIPQSLFLTEPLAAGVNQERAPG